MQKEVTRVEGFGAWEIVPFREYRDMSRKYPGRTSIGYIVPVLTCKADPSGDPREIDVVNKFRISMSEGGREDLVAVETHSLCVDDITNRFVTLIAPAIKAHQTSIDVGGAYFHGTPPTMAEGGRMVYRPGFKISGRTASATRMGPATFCASPATCPGAVTPAGFGRNTMTASCWGTGSARP
jgi:hypothetical protein